MREPAELTRLRESLPRPHAVEAFEHLRERKPHSDAELEAFIDEYVLEAYTDGVEDWDDLGRTALISRRSMDAPLGQELRREGYKSLWHYIASNGLADLDILRKELNVNSIAPIGFHSYVIEVAEEDGKWEFALRTLAAHNLNAIRQKSKRDVIAFMGIHRIALDSPRNIAWIETACNEIVGYVQNNPTVLDGPVRWDDQWLMGIIGRSASSK